MHIHILGIGGTFMAGIARLAQQLGHRVTGCDHPLYPPMSTQLENLGIEVITGYDAAQLKNLHADEFIVGNAISRGNQLLEAIMNARLPYRSGPEWLADEVLKDRWVLAVSGTHGKTTTTSMLAYVLQQANLAPGYLIGGIAQDFEHSADLGQSPFFVIEADEYDSAFFDKRAKFMHYRPRTLIINNLEFDHADIYDNLAAIQKQFSHLLRTVPGEGLVITPYQDAAIEPVREKAQWTPQQTVAIDNASATLAANLLTDDGSHFQVMQQGKAVAQVKWSQLGLHNVANALVTLLAAQHVGVSLNMGAQLLSGFAGVKRRLEKIAEGRGMILYDDFAHHPTAIATTLAGLKAQLSARQRIIAILEPRSYTMRAGVHADTLQDSVADAALVFWSQPANAGWSMAHLHQPELQRWVMPSVAEIVDQVKQLAHDGDRIVIMSNGGFDDIYHRLADALDLTWCAAD
jgi:UDP-N-acetylmuramate: L-alanyl-gamma-D-glutamyl-meso-diaminopimelate ligase